MKIKTFQFLLSNFCGNDLHTNDCFKDSKYKASQNTPYSTERQIDRKLNRWIEKNNPVIHDIKITTYTIDRHNNGGDDTVVAIYTVTYDLPAGAEAKDEA